MLYHSRDEWRAPFSFGELLEGPAAAIEALGAHVPQFSFVLNDLSVIADDELRRGAMDGVVRLLFKHVWDGDLPVKLASWGELLRTVASEETAGLRSLSRVIEYLLQASDVSIDVLEQVMTQHVDPKMSETIQTTADRLRREGRREGRLEERAQLVIRLLEGRKMRVDESTRNRIVGCRDEELLDKWFDRALVASALAELFDE